VVQAIVCGAVEGNDGVAARQAAMLKKGRSKTKVQAVGSCVTGVSLAGASAVQDKRRLSHSELDDGSTHII